MIEEPRVFGADSYRGACNACNLAFVGAAGAKALYEHHKALHSAGYGRGPQGAHHTPVWANGKAYPWVAPKVNKGSAARLDTVLLEAEIAGDVVVLS